MQESSGAALDQLDADTRKLFGSEELFVRFMRHFPGLAWLKDLNGRFVYANDAANKALAGGFESLIGRSNADLMTPALAAQCDESDQQGARSEAGIQVLESFLAVDGTLRSALVSKFAVPGANGKPAFIGGMAIDITERIQAQEQLRLSEERLRLATETGKVGVWDWDIDAGRVLWTPSLYTLHGLSPVGSPVTVETFLSLVHPEDRRLVEDAIASTLERDAPYELEIRAVRPDGRIVWLFTSARVIRHDGKPVRMLGAAIDLTERKQTEFALRESEERFATAFNASPLSITLTSLATGKLFEVNNSFVKTSGYSREEAIGRTSMELGLWADTPARDQMFETLRTHGRISNRECRLRTRDGRQIVALLSAESIVIQNEHYALTVVQDITDREQAAEALRQGEERLRLALRAASAGVWMMDLGSNSLFWSEEFAELYGYDASTPRTLATWLQSVHAEDRAQFTSDQAQRLASTQTEFRREFRILHPKLGTRWLLDLGRIERDGSGAATRLVGINLDISRAKEIEAELREADHHKNRFLATLAHELRNPLAPLRNGLEVMRLTRGTGPAAEQAVNMMDRQLRQMVRLIDDLLDLSRISRGKIELRRERVTLASVLQNAMEVSKPLIDTASHQLELVLPERELLVYGDVTRLSQVFANLLNNAAKYTPDGGRIVVTITAEPGWASVAVRDNGIGIAPSMLGKVFDMFTQGERPSDMAHGGLGIGLNIARQLVEMHGGSLDARSEGRGSGSEFIVRLPLASSAAPSPEREEEVAPNGRGLRLLIADDNTDAASSLALMLEIAGHEVRTAHNGLEAVEIAKQFDPQMVFLDLGMPVLDGFDACRRIRELPGMSDRPIAALTGWGQTDDKRRSNEAGFTHHLVKPVDAKALEQLIAREQLRLADGQPPG